MSHILKLIETAFLLSVGLFELVVVLNIATGYAFNVEITQAYLSMDNVPARDHWRSLNVPGLAHLAPLAALLLHLAAGAAIVWGSILLLMAKDPGSRSAATSKITIGLAIGIAFYLAFFLLFGNWLRINYTEYNFISAALTTAILYILLSIYVNIRYPADA